MNISYCEHQDILSDSKKNEQGNPGFHTTRACDIVLAQAVFCGHPSRAHARRRTTWNVIDRSLYLSLYLFFIKVSTYNCTYVIETYDEQIGSMRDCSVMPRGAPALVAVKRTLTRVKHVLSDGTRGPNPTTRIVLSSVAVIDDPCDHTA